MLRSRVVVAVASFTVCLAFVVACVGSDSQPTSTPTQDDASSSSSSGDTGNNTADSSASAIDGTTGDAAADTGVAWTPKQLTGLAVWLDGTQVDATNMLVNQWKDQSGGNNHANQADPNRKPQLLDNAVNGHPAIDFNGTTMSLEIADAPAIQFGTGGFAIIVCMRHAVDPTAFDVNLQYASIIHKVPITAPDPYNGWGLLANNPSAGTTTSADLFQLNRLQRLPTTRTGLNDNQFHIIGARRLQTTLDVRVDGKPEGANTDAANALDVSNAGEPVHIGANSNNTFYFLKGAIAELVLVKGTLIDGDFVKLETYLKTKYAIATQ